MRVMLSAPLDELPRNPITGIAGCCARAASGHAAAAPPRSVMKWAAPHAEHRGSSNRLALPSAVYRTLSLPQYLIAARCLNGCVLSPVDE